MTTTKNLLWSRTVWAFLVQIFTDLHELIIAGTGSLSDYMTLVVAIVGIVMRHLANQQTTIPFIGGK
ncbi:MAG: hypothetical protein OEQ74_03320 [Gammaproteobacteria bacterium]|nr:hypothetical protein [Gammaproteobacteria bacterium]